jgi:hypothetical protein
VSKEQNLNEIFVLLSGLGIEVVSMRNKVNRLEEIFMRLVEGRANRSRRRSPQSPTAVAPDGRRRRSFDRSWTHSLDWS